MSDLAKVSAAVKADGVQNVGFTWAARDPRPTRARSAAAVSTHPGGIDARDIRLGREDPRVCSNHWWPRFVTANGALMAKPNVLVQFCQVRADRTDVDVNGNPSMFTKTVGSGLVVLFRGSKRIEGRGSRATLRAPTVFSDLAGKPLLLAPGGTLVALARLGPPA